MILVSAQQIHGRQLLQAGFSVVFRLALFPQWHLINPHYVSFSVPKTDFSIHTLPDLITATFAAEFRFSAIFLGTKLDLFLVTDTNLTHFPPRAISL